MASSTFTILDFTILLIIGGSIFIGFFRGATREVLGIASWISSFAIVFYGLPIFRPLGKAYISNPMVSDAVVGLLLFLISLTLFFFVGRSISSTVKGSMLGALDRSLGLVFGFARGILVICIIYLGFDLMFSKSEHPVWVKQARFTEWAQLGAVELKRLIPSDYLPEQTSTPPIEPLNAKDLIKASLPTIEQTVKNLSTLKPTKPEPVRTTPQRKDNLESLIEQQESLSP